MSYRTEGLGHTTAGTGEPALYRKRWNEIFGKDKRKDKRTEKRALPANLVFQPALARGGIGVAGYIAAALDKRDAKRVKKMVLYGVTIVEDAAVPEGELWLEDKDGRRLKTIQGLR